MLRRNMNMKPSIEQLWGKYRRLRAELAAAYDEPQWNPARVDRLANEIAGLEHLLSHAGSRAAVRVAVPNAASPETSPG